MKFPLSWQTAVLAALLQCVGAAHLKRKQPQANVIRNLRTALDSRTDELQQQKNIAHGLELEVRELQSELQAEKKALSGESQKEQTLQQKLNRVRALVDDVPIVKSNSKKTEKGPAVPAVTPMMAPMSDVSLDSAPLQDPLPSVSDSELEAEAFQAVSIPASAKPMAAQAVEEPAPVVHARQTMPQEPPPFLEDIQSASVVKVTPEAPKVTKVVAKVAKKTQVHAQKAASGARKATTHHAPKAKAQKVAPRRAAPAKQIAKAVAAPAKAKAPVQPMPVSQPAPVTATKDNDAAPAPTSDFDALEAQLHEEDRRIQDLDRENALDANSDAMSDGGDAPQAANKAPLKTTAAQPKLELDSSEGSMDDLLNVEAPGPDSNEAMPVAAQTDAASADAALALPQLAEGEVALADNQFLAQIAPGPRRA